MSTATEPGLTPVKFSRLTRRGVLLGLSGPQLALVGTAGRTPARRRASRRASPATRAVADHAAG